MNKTEFKGSVMLNPVPVVMITSRNSEGKDNVFTVAWIGTVCTKPPMLSISIRPERLSYEYIKETMEFTVNMPHRKLTRETDYVGVVSGRKEDKIKTMGFSIKDGTHTNTGLIEECPINIECKVREIIPLGTHDLFIAEVLGSHIDSSLMDENGKIHFEWADLINYAHGEYYPMAQNSIGKFGYAVSKENPLTFTKAAPFSKRTAPHRKKVNKDNQSSLRKTSKTRRKKKNQ